MEGKKEDGLVKIPERPPGPGTTCLVEKRI